ncbi:peptidylprolyl isomerase [Sphingomonas sp. I4]
MVNTAAVAAQSSPSDAEIARYYQTNAAKYAAAQKRDVTQVVVLDQAGANALAAKAKAGTSLADAARAAGLEASVQKGVVKAAYAAQSSAAVADAVFGAGQGAIVGPVRGTLGFVVAKVDAITQVPGKTLAQARPEIVTELTKQKQAAALGELRNTIEDALSGNATFDEVVADRKLQAQTTPAVTAQGAAPTPHFPGDAGTARDDHRRLHRRGRRRAADRADRPGWQLRRRRRRPDPAFRPAPAGAGP